MKSEVKKVFRHGKPWGKKNANLGVLRHPEGSFTETQKAMRKKAGLS